MKKQLLKQAGFSLIEMLIVIVIVSILCAFVLFGFKTTSGESKRTALQIKQIIEERQEAARRLNQKNTQGIEQREPIAINFADLTETRSLKTEGIDLNADHLDDNSGEPLTYYDQVNNNWVYQYEGQPVKLPTNWRLAENQLELGLPTIPNSALTTTLRLDENGRPADKAVGPADENRGDEAPFWAVYYKDNQNNNFVFAIGIHGSGAIEIWNYDFTRRVWVGNGGRQ